MNYVLAIIGDTQFGGSTAISTEKFVIHNRYTLEEQVASANRLQRWLLECWNNYWEYVYYLRGKGRKEKKLYVVHLGDVIDGNHHNTNQIVHDVHDQVKIAIEMLEPIRMKADQFIGIFGTEPSHAGQDHVTEAEIYRDLQADQVGHAITLDIDGTLIDLAHHGRSGARPWTSSAVNLGAEVLIDYAQQGHKIPNYIFRGHCHKFTDSGSHFVNTRVIQCPSWQLKTSHGWRVSTNTVRSDIGGVILHDGILDLTKVRYKGQPDNRIVVKL